jgi:hypothetical protein
MKKKLVADVVAFGGAALGSALIASNSGVAIPGYVCFLSSSIASIYLLSQVKGAPKSLILQNIFFVGVNIFGIIRYS